MNTSIPTALSSLSQSVENFSSLNVIALQMIKLISKIMASFYAFGFCIRHVSDIFQPAYYPRIRARQWNGDFYREIVFGVELDNSGHDADCKFRWNIVRFDSYLEYT